MTTDPKDSQAAHSRSSAFETDGARCKSKVRGGYNQAKQT
jgi:hypothetical protein